MLPPSSSSLLPLPKLHVKSESVCEDRLGVFEWNSRLLLVRLPVDGVLVVGVLRHGLGIYSYIHCLKQ